MRPKREADSIIRELAERQYGVVARRQLLALGVTEREIARRLPAGRLIPLHRGVYAVGHGALHPRARFMAAVLALGPSAVISHRTAASLHDLLSTSQTLIDLTVGGVRLVRSQRGLRIRTTTDWHPEDITQIDGIPVTSVARTLLDLAAILSPTQLRRALEQADRSGVLNLLALARALERRPRAKGRAKLQALLDEYTGASPTKSELERQFLQLIARAGLPDPRVNVLVGGLEVDIYWPEWGLVVELDGRAFHSAPRAFEADRIRDARLQRLGLRVLRITDKRLTNEPDAVIEDILALARLSGSGGRLDLRLARN